MTEVNKRQRRHPFQILLSRPVSSQRCFMCRRPMREVESSDEHIFPRWLLKRQNLYQHSIILGNDTSFKYAGLKVPCCRRCNEAGERALESPISQAFQIGYDEVIKLDRQTLALWCLKIYYGIRFKEHLLPKDRQRHHLGKITSRSDLEEMAMLFMILQGIRTEITYSVEPWSVWVYRLKVPTEEVERFSFADIVGVSMFSIRINDTGIIVLPRDFALVRTSDFAQTFDGFLNETLHPQQFNELAARAAYLDIIRQIGVNYLVSFDHPPHIVHIGSLAGRPWREWEWPEYNKILAFVSKIPYHVWQPDPVDNPGLFRTFLEDNQGQFIDVPLDALPSIAYGDEVWSAGPQAAAP